MELSVEYCFICVCVFRVSQLFGSIFSGLFGLVTRLVVLTTTRERCAAYISNRGFHFNVILWVAISPYIREKVSFVDEEVGQCPLVVVICDI